MASGFGLAGGRSRCFPQWQETHKCYAMEDNPKNCLPFLEDYFECLHHNKEIERQETIKKEERRQAAQRKKREENAKKSGVAPEKIIPLNLLNSDQTPVDNPGDK